MLEISWSRQRRRRRKQAARGRQPERRGKLFICFQDWRSAFGLLLRLIGRRRAGHFCLGWAFPRRRFFSANFNGPVSLMTETSDRALNFGVSEAGCSVRKLPVRR